MRALLINNVIRKMKKNKTQQEVAAGKLISAIQKEWNKELGESSAKISEEVMYRGHDLLKASKANQVKTTLGGMSVSQYLGETWVHRHPSVKQSIANLESVINEANSV